MNVEAGEVLGAGRSHIIKRPRLTRLLDEANAPVIVLLAPAGYGKTTLAREWLNERPHGWYRGNSATSDVAALALGLARAAGKIVPGAEERLTTRLRVSNAPADEIDRLASLLAEDLAEWPEDAWLAFDDYHFACDSEPAERFVECLALSSPVRILVASRSRPNWASARRVLYGEICEVGRSLLAMNRDEAQSVLTERGEHEPQGLISLADGWPALLAIASHPDDPSLRRGRLSEEVYSYFVEELYQALPEAAQRGLRRLSLAPSVTEEIADSLVGDQAASILEQATALGFFSSVSYEQLEFHPLVRSFLFSRFNKACDDPEGKLLSELVHQLIASEAWDEAFALIERFFDESLLLELFEAAILRMVDQARLRTLERWIQFAKGRGLLLPIIGAAEAEVAFKRGDLRRAEVIAMQTSLQFPPNHPLRSKVLLLAGTSAHLTRRDLEALEYFSDAQAAAHAEIDSRRALWGRFLATESLELTQEADALLSEFSSTSNATSDDLLRIAGGRIWMALLTGRVRETLDAQSSIALLVERSIDPLIQTSFLNVYAGTLAVAGRYEEAAHAAQNQLACATEYSLDFVVPFAHLHLAEAHWGMGNARSCKLSMANSERTSIPGDDLIMSVLNTLRARLSLARKAPEEAIAILDRGHRVAMTSMMYAEYLAWSALAHALANRNDAATTLARRAESLSRRVEVAGLTPWTQAVIAVRSDRGAVDIVGSAFQTTIDGGNVDAFVSAYRSEPQLLHLLAQRDESRDRLVVILEAARDLRLAESVGLRLERAVDLRRNDLLTGREQQVIDLVSQGLTNKQIGRALYITEATVKVHLRKICRKFGVRSRTEAAMRAAELSD